MQVKSTSFHRDLDKAERHFDRTARSMERRAQRFQRNMKKAWTGIAAGTAAVAAGLGAATSMSAKFENQLVEVQKVTDPKVMRAMKEEIEDMANVMPLAHEGLTQIVADAGRMGIKGVESLTAFTETVAKLSVATELTAERAAKDLGRITKWLNIPAKYAENLGAAINELSNNIPADADEIIRTLGKTGQQFEILGASTQTTLALSGAVSALADSAERGGTRMRRLIQQMQEPGTIADIAKAFGMTADEMERMIDNSPIKAIKMMAKAFKEGGTEADKLREALASTSEVTLTILANNLDMVNNSLAMTGEQLENPTSLLKEFKAAVNTTISQLKMLWNTIKNVFMNALGDQANQILKDFIKNIRAWALTIEDLISNNEELQRAIFQVIKAILHIGGVITVIGLVGKAFFALMSPVTVLIAALMTLGALWRWNAWGMQEFIKGSLGKAVKDLWGIFIMLTNIGKIISSELKLDLDFGMKEEPSKDIKTAIEESLGIGSEKASWIENGLRMAIGLAVWKGSGSLGLAVLSATLGFDWTVEMLGLGEKLDKVLKAFVASYKNWAQFLTGEIGFIELLKAEFGEGGVKDFLGIGVQYRDEGPGEPVLEENMPDMKKGVQKVNKEALKLQQTLDRINAGLESKSPFGKEKTLEDYKKAIQKILDDYAGIETPWTQEAVNELTELIEKIEDAEFKIDAETKRLLEGAKLQIEISGFEPEKKQQGGFAGTVPGTGSGDIVPAMLEPGEFVWPKKMVQKMPWIVDMWRGFKEGGAVSAGRVFYGPNAGDEGSLIQKLITLLESWIKAPAKSPIKPENVELFKKDLGAVVTLFKEFSGLSADFDKIMEYLEGEMEALKEDMKGLTKNADIAGMSLEDLNEKLKNLDVSQIGQLPEALKRIMSVEFVKEIPKGATPQAWGPTRTSVKGMKPRKGEDWTTQALITLQSFDSALGPATEQLVNLEEIAGKYGVSQETVQGTIDAVRKKFVRLTGSSEAFDKALEKAREEADKFKIPEEVKKMGDAALTVASAFQEVAEATGKLSAGTSARLGGIMSAAQSALSGNWLQAAMDLFTGFMKGWIEDLKAEKKELQKKLDATFSMLTEGLRNLTQEINSLVGSLAGPFSNAISGALDGLVGFFKATQQFVQGNILDMMQTAFSALLSVVTGVTSSLIGLLKKSDQWEALQSELEPIWQALANALGTLLMPLVALARWLREYLGISKDVGKDMEDIADLNVPAGFKRAREAWEAAAPGQPVGTAGDGGGMEIPEWAKQIIKPIKDKLIPYLKGSKDFLGLIETWAKNAWKWIQKLILEWIPRFFDILQAVGQWVANIDWETIFGYIGDAMQWFADNFPDAWDKFKTVFGEFMQGAFGEKGFLWQIDQIRQTLNAIAKSMGVAAGAIGGAGLGAAIGGAFGGPLGAIIGGGIGAAVGGLAGWLGFQEGGIVTGPTPGIVGEAGPEAVIPLDRMGDFGNNLTVEIKTSGDGVADQIIDEIQVKNKRLTGSRSTSAALNRRTYS